MAVACCTRPAAVAVKPGDVCLAIAADGKAQPGATAIAPDKMQQAVEDIINEA